MSLAGKAAVVTTGSVGHWQVRRARQSVATNMGFDFDLDLLRVVRALRNLASPTRSADALRIGQRNELIDDWQMVKTPSLRWCLTGLASALASRRLRFEFRRQLLLWRL